MQSSCATGRFHCVVGQKALRNGEVCRGGCAEVTDESVWRNTVGGNEAKIRKYIQEQEFNDQMCDQLSFKEYEDPFKNVADFDDDDSPEVPTDSMRK